MLPVSSTCNHRTDHIWLHAIRLAERSGSLFRLLTRSSNFFFGFFHGRLKVLFDHFHFLVNHVQFRLHRLAKILGGVFKALDGFADLTSDFRELFWTK